MAVANAPEYGGYDHTFAGQVPEKFMCIICTKVLQEPHLTSCCGQHFCKSCLENWFQKQQEKSCPHCREEDFNHFLNKERKREINELKTHCTHHEEGCQWIGELGNLQTHLCSESGCDYVEVECTNKCRLDHKTRKFQRKALRDHLDNKCCRRRYKCEYCGHEDTYRSITGKGYCSTANSCHYDRCREYPLECPNRCGAKAIKRKDMSTHLDECPLEPVKCPFEVEGCTARVVRKGFDNHMSTQIQHHLLLVKTKQEEGMKEVEKMKTKHDRLVKAISMNVDSLLQTCTEGQKLPLQSIRAIIDESYHLKKGDSLTIEIPNLSQYKTSGEVWRSPPFYIMEGYKMCLAIHPNGTGWGTGTHVSISLILMQGEFDDQLGWPTRCYNKAIEIKVKSKQPPRHTIGYGKFLVRGLYRAHDESVVYSVARFLKHGTEDEREVVQGTLAEVCADF